MSDRTAFPQRAVAQLLGSNGPIHAVSYSASPGTYILTGSADRSIRLYNPQPPTPPPAPSHITRPTASALPTAAALPVGRLIQTYAAHGYEVLSLAVAADNARFASAGGDRAVFLWDVATAQTTRRFGGTQHGHTGRVNCVAFGGADDSLVVSGGLDTTVRVWDARSGGGKPVQVLGEARDAVSAVVVAGAEIVTGSVDGRVRSYDVRMGRATTDVLGASVTSLCLARDAKTVLVGTLDSKVRLMDRANGACLKTYADAGWRNEELRVQSVLGGKERFVLAGDEMTSPAAAAAAAGSGGSVEVPATPSGAANEGRIWAWDLLTGKLVARLAVPWGAGGSESRKRVVGRDGKEKERKNVVSCIAWKEGGFGDQFCVGGTSGAVTVFGEG
ncbi:WD40-repeat-containing domain protein [Lasiosphaeris hirsuta]|uniref:WD40-repeat-containing domain protein n=1 Tax=Lasiosphaeris hirsuta TaxID=260670 RepID=A0AA40AQ39_9PEZI|nr:WD40-repeat-containing domain protein [Lasiosphaeris hirsuta]